MKNTRHVTLFALQASDAHSYIAEKRSSPLSCNPIPPSILGCSRRKNFWTGFFSSIYCTSFLISFNQRNTTGAVSPQLCFFFSLSLFFSWIHFLSKTFSISPGDLQPPNSRWHLKYTNLSRILSLSHVVPLCSSTLCSNRLWLFHHSQTLHFHIHTQEKKRHTSDGRARGGGELIHHHLPWHLWPAATYSNPTLLQHPSVWSRTLRRDIGRGRGSQHFHLLFYRKLVLFAQKGSCDDKVGQSILIFPGSDTILWGNKDVFNKSLVWCQKGASTFWRGRKKKNGEHACLIWQPLYKQ